MSAGHAAEKSSQVLPNYLYLDFDFSVHHNLTGFALKNLRRVLQPGRRWPSNLAGRQVVVRIPRDPEKRQKVCAQLRLAGRVLREH